MGPIGAIERDGAVGPSRLSAVRRPTGGGGAFCSVFTVIRFSLLRSSVGICGVVLPWDLSPTTSAEFGCEVGLFTHPRRSGFSCVVDEGWWLAYMEFPSIIDLDDQNGSYIAAVDYITVSIRTRYTIHILQHGNYKCTYLQCGYLCPESKIAFQCPTSARKICSSLPLDRIL